MAYVTYFSVTIRFHVTCATSMSLYIDTHVQVCCYRYAAVTGMLPSNATWYITCVALMLLYSVVCF